MFHVKQAQKVAGFIYNLPQNLLFVLEKKHSQITSISANIYWLILLKNSCLLLSAVYFIAWSMMKLFPVKIQNDHGNGMGLLNPKISPLTNLS